MYVAKFNDCITKVTKAYLILNLCFITASGIQENEEEDKGSEEEATKEGEVVGG